MDNTPIYTIGYGNRSISEFLDLLFSYNIDHVVDVRTRPYSKYNPDFTREALSATLEKSSIRYVFMGEKLGGRPAELSCYTDGHVDYNKYSQTELYQEGISRLKRAHYKRLSVVLMCSEQKPQDCHRCKLIGETLHSENIEVLHINELGQLKKQDEIIKLLQSDQPALFDMGFMSRKKYLPRDYAESDTI